MSTDTSSYFSPARTGTDEDRPKTPWVKFADEGDEVTLTITDKGKAPDYEFNRNPDAPKVQKRWPNGELMEFLVITGTLDAPATVGDGSRAGRRAEVGEEVNVAVKGKLMTAAIGNAVREAGPEALNDEGKPDVMPGGKLLVKFTGWTTAKMGEAKTYSAKYKPGPRPSANTSSFLDGSANGGGLSAPAGKAPQDSDPPFHNGFHRPGRDEVVV